MENDHGSIYFIFNQISCEVNKDMALDMQKKLSSETTLQVKIGVCVNRKSYLDAPGNDHWLSLSLKNEIQKSREIQRGHFVPLDSKKIST